MTHDSREYKIAGEKKSGGRKGHRSKHFRGRGSEPHGNTPRRNETHKFSERPMARE